MQTVTLTQFPPSPAPSVVTVGNFDGVHRGHQSLIGEVVAHARERQAASIVVTFEPHTRTVLYPETTTPILTTLHEKAAILQKLGVDTLVCIPFDAVMAAMAPEAFVREVLVDRLGAVEWVMGEGHGWGFGRAGNRELLHNLMGGKHFSVSVSKLVSRQSMPISSTEIRARILRGEMNEAAEALGHPYAIVARRIRGAGIAGGLGFPTLNFEAPRAPKVLPPAGVYAGVLQFGRHEYQGALYFGDCPTFEHRDTHLEFHALTPLAEDPEFGGEACVWIHHFLRADRAFATERQLQIQIEKDVNDIRRILSRE